MYNKKKAQLDTENKNKNDGRQEKKMENKIKEMTINGMNIHRVYRLIILTFFVKFN